MELIKNEPKTDNMQQELEEIYKYICDGRVYKAREALEQMLGKTQITPDLA
jgi:hypothetical protein